MDATSQELRRYPRSDRAPHTRDRRAGTDRRRAAGNGRQLSGCPRPRRRARGQRRRPPARARHDLPSHDRRSDRGTRSGHDRLPAVEQVRRHDRAQLAVRGVSRGRRRRSRPRSRRTALCRAHGPRLAAGSCGEQRRLLRARLHTGQCRRAVLGAHAVWAGSRPDAWDRHH